MQTTSLKVILLTVILQSFCNCTGHAQNVPVKMEVKGKYGFIDASGKLVIPVQFRDAGSFSEGLCPVRLNGTYGFIDVKGNYAIPSQYDYALGFKNGFARVWKNGKPFYIDEKGHQPFDCSRFLFINDFENNRGLVYIKNRRPTIIDTKGNCIVPPVYDAINEFENNRAVVEINTGNKKNHKVKYAVIDPQGKIIIDFNKFSSIETFHNGYAKAGNGTCEGRGSRTCFIDTMGNILTQLPCNTFDYDHQINEGLIAVQLPNLVPLKTKYGGTDETEDFWTLVNAKGETVVRDSSFKQIMDVSDDRFFAGDYHAWHLYNLQGKQLTANIFNEVINERFENGRAIVKDDKKDKFGVIDVNGKYIIEPTYDKVHKSENQIGYLYVAKELSSLHENEIDSLESIEDTLDSLADATEDTLITDSLDAMIDAIEEYIETIDESEDKLLWGVIDSAGKEIIPLQFTGLSAEPVNGLLYAEQNDFYGYINVKGEWVFKEKRAETKNDILNIDYMLRGHFYAQEGSRPVNTGHGNSSYSSYPQAITASVNKQQNNLYALIEENTQDIFYDRFEAVELYIINQAKDTAVFSAQDGRLYVKLQAKDAEGNWRDIEYLPNSWCGNSYHTLKLAPNTCWMFAIPKFNGDFKTKLRARIDTQNPRHESKNKTFYSNEFEGSINPGQFWRRQDYSPQGIMDPYLE